MHLCYTYLPSTYLPIPHLLSIHPSATMLLPSVHRLSHKQGRDEHRTEDVDASGTRAPAEAAWVLEVFSEFDSSGRDGSRSLVCTHIQ